MIASFYCIKSKHFHLAFRLLMIWLHLICLISHPTCSPFLELGQFSYGHKTRQIPFCLPILMNILAFAWNAFLLFIDPNHIHLARELSLLALSTSLPSILFNPLQSGVCPHYSTVQYTFLLFSYH